MTSRAPDTANPSDDGPPYFFTRLLSQLNRCPFGFVIGRLCLAIHQVVVMDGGADRSGEDGNGIPEWHGGRSLLATGQQRSILPPELRRLRCNQTGSEDDTQHDASGPASHLRRPRATDRGACTTP